MGKKRHPFESAFGAGDIRVDGEALRQVSRDSIPLPWSPAAGVCVFDAFGGHEPSLMPMPPQLSEMPPVIYTHTPYGPVFLGQRWSAEPVTSWEEVGSLGVDRAALCVRPSDTLDSVDMSALERQLRQTDAAWVSDGGQGVAIHVMDDGEYFYYRGLDAKGECIAWVVCLADVDIPRKMPRDLVPAALKPFIKPQLRYGVACRKAPTTTFEEITRSLRFPKKDVMARFWRGAPTFDECRIGSVKLKQVEAVDYHFFDGELARIGLAEPAYYVRVMFTDNRDSAKAAHWKMMLAVLHALATNADGIVYQFDGASVFDALAGEPFESGVPQRQLTSQTDV